MVIESFLAGMVAGGIFVYVVAVLIEYHQLKRRG